MKRVEKDELAKNADIVIVLCDLNPNTKDLVNKDFLKQMKNTAILVNAARVSTHQEKKTSSSPQGPIVNSEDLAEALEKGEIFGAGLDVITGEPHINADHPLVKAKNCVVLPHMGSADYDTRNAMAERCARNAIQGAKGEDLVAEVKL